MATQNENIKRELFSSDWQQFYEDTTTSNGDPEWYYISAPAFVAEVKNSYNIWSSAHSIVSIDYYDWTNGWANGTWVNVFYKDYVNGKNSESAIFYHNKDGMPNDGTFNWRDTEESRNFHLWRLRVKRTSGNSNSEQRVRIWAGGCGQLNDSEYQDYVQDRYLISNGSISEYIWRAGRSADSSSYDAEALSKFNPTNLKGSQITATNGEHLIPYFTKEGVFNGT